MVAHVLDVEDQGVEPGELGRRGAKRGGAGPVEGVDRQAGAPIALVSHRHHVGRVAAHAVLGAEEGPELHPRRALEQVGGVAQAAIHRGGVGDETHRLPAQLPEVPGHQGVEPGLRAGSPLPAAVPGHARPPGRDSTPAGAGYRWQ
jgi:hypothetical protein